MRITLPDLKMEVDLFRIERVYLPTETLGSWYDNKIVLAKTMELPWNGNARNKSCIPEGVYFVSKEKPIDGHDGRHIRPYWHFRLHDVPDRSGILVHKITYVKDLRGCIGVGLHFADFNQDSVPDMADSTLALTKLVDNMPDKFYLHITKKL